MSVMIVTSIGDLVIDLFTNDCPFTTRNFLKLCKIKYYNGCLFHTVQKDFTAQTGDPTGTGSGGDSIYKFLYGDQARFFPDEIRPNLKHSKMGTVAMASAGENLNASQFYITLRDDLDYLDEKHTVFGEVAEGHDTLLRINEAYVDEKGRPFKNIRIKHTYVLEDPFDDPARLADLIPDASPEGKPKEEVDDEVRLEDDWVPMDEQLASEELEEVIRTREAHSRAVVLESIGDIPDADVKPPENVLFVCKLNPVTEDEDLHTIFSRFGTVTSAEIIRDFKTGDSLCYAFVEFEDNDACERAYFKMDNALIDDRRIHVDFSQSVSKLWNQFRRKGSQQGKGCFKCGALDHIARDCSGDSSLPQQKYVLKDDSKQRGGEKNAGYEMVFDEEEGSPEQGERNRNDGQDDRAKRHKSEKSGSEGKQRNHGNGESIDKSNERYKRDDHDGRGASRNERGYRESRDGNRRHDRDSRERRDGGRREDRDSRERKDDGQREGRDSRERRGDSRREGRDSRERRGDGPIEDRDSRERRNDGEYRKRTNDNIERRDKREEARTRERDGGRSRRGEREDGRSNVKGSDCHRDEKRHDKSEEQSHRRKDSHFDVQKRREDRGDGSRSSRDNKDRDVDDKRRGDRR